MTQLQSSTTANQVPGTREHIVIAGAGLSGLTAALHLLAKGHRVTVLEASDHVGGRCATEDVTIPGVGTIRADTGATVLTMPSLIDDALAGVGLTATELDPLWQMERLDPAYHARYPGGRTLDVSGDEVFMANQIQQFLQAKGTPREHIGTTVSGHRAMTGWLEKLFNSSYDRFLNRSYDSPLDMVGDTTTMKRLIELLRLGAFGSLGKQVNKRLGDEELGRVFSFQALYAGVGPRDARAVYGCISHMDTGIGVHYPVASATGSGSGAVPELLARGVRAAGGEIRLGTAVQGLTVAPGRRGDVTDVTVVADGITESVSCDGFIATVDYPVLDHWLAAAGAKPRHRQVPRRWSPSAVVAHGAAPTTVTDTWPEAHHTISFGENWDATFDEICAPTGGTVMTDPSLLITRPAVTDPARIIKGTDGRAWEPLSILAPCPNLNSAPVVWDTVADSYIRELTATLELRGYTGISTHWQYGRVDTPTTWAATGMGAGTPFGLAHLFRQTGPFRPRNYSSTGPANLVHAGSTTVPGVGVPTVMLSGALAADRFKAIHS
ncbi:phytoene desaturase [Corynebacterium sp. TAE3-ERU12]|uniref:phytoene desaturase family protein n=1 Tax=Corynebacterium sp. TAE3-ERU12 TaxID=2849491 RepID=UPI001C48EBA5|nr:phytoene desaturase family protein [Corynebacterium sp. TAE3-ERU12]MBV7296237.1 phytoene desaturase [Corynebacterium sp. TAE3-ERU12]